MKSIFYLIGILVAGAAAVFAFLTGQKHLELTKQTYQTRVTNDGLKKDKHFLEGAFLKIEEHRDGDIDTANVSKAIEVRKSRALLGQKNLAKLARDPQRVAYTAKLEENGDPVVFGAYNKMLNDTDQYGKALKYVKAEAEDRKTSAANLQASSNVVGSVGSYVNGVLAGKIQTAQGEVDTLTTDRKGLEGEIAKYEEAEAKISKMFVAEGITTLEGGKEKLVQLEATRKKRLNEEENLAAEQEQFKEDLAKNEAKIQEQVAYAAKRKLSLSTNEKTFSLTSVDFDWGFAVLKGDPNTKFFINQKLMVLRGNSFIGTIIVSAVDKDRVVANIDYKSLKPGMTIRKGDRAILAVPADR